MIKPALVVSFACALLGGCAAAPARPKTEAVAPPPPRLHRLEYTLVVDDGSAKVRRTYALGLEEKNGGEIRSGANTSLSPAGGAVGPRVDTGVRLQSRYAMVGDALALHVDFESSYADGNRSIQKIAARGDTVVATGARAEVLRAHDPSGNVDYTLMVTATKLR